MPVKTPNSHTIYPKTSLTNTVFSVEWFNRVALFIVFFWFGFLKILKISPAEQLVTHLHQTTFASMIPIDAFLLILGAAECIIGAIWLIPKWTKLAFWIFLFHMFTTFLPLFFLPKDTWQNMMVLTLTGQYIIKNVVLVASAYTILKFTNR